MITSVAAVAAACLATSVVGLLAAGARWRRARLYLTVLYSIVIAVPSYLLAEYVWQLPRAHLWVGLAGAGISILVIALLEKDWNPPSQVFLGALIAASITFLALGIRFAFWSGIGVGAAIGSALLVGLEAFAFLLLAVGAHDVLNVVGRVRWHRRTAGLDDHAGEEPFVSIHVATHNEPPELVLDTLRSLARLDYKNYEVIVLDNNTDDPGLWRPLEEYCRSAALRFVHLENWPGFKAGALNHGLEITDERAEIIAVVDADFVVQPDFLKRTVGYFRDRKVGLVQTKQDFVTDDDVPYLRRLALTYRTFDEITMPSRNEYDSIIFAGTMGLIRRQAIVDAGGWAEWCVTEDAELSLRVLGCGYSGIYVDESFGRGIMPLTFAGLKRQRFRWCFGGIQILRAHWRLLLKGRERRVDGADLRLTPRQRFSYLSASLQWFQSLLTLIFSALLLLFSVAMAASIDLELRPLAGMFVAVPLLLLTSGLSKVVWGLRARLQVGVTDVVAVVAIWLALSWAVAQGCIQGLAGRRLPFFRTPKFKGSESFRQALTSTRAETPLALALAGAAVAIGLSEPASARSAFLIALCGWGAVVFGCAPAVAFAASRADLHSGALKKRRYLESIRGRTSSYHRPLAYGFAVAALTVLMVVFAGGSTTVGPGDDELDELFTLPDREEAEVVDEDGDDEIAQPGPGNNARDDGPRTEVAAPTGSTGGAASNATGARQPGRGQGRDTAPGQNGAADPAPAPGQNGGGPAPQASDAPGQQPDAQPTQAAHGTPKPKPSPKPRPTNAGGNGNGKNAQP